MAHFAVLSLPVGDEEISAGFFQQHIREVFSTHGGFLRQHVVCADDACQHLTGESGFVHMVDGGWVVAHKGKFAAGLVGGADVFGDGLHTALDQVEHFHRESAHRALQLAAVGHHIGGVTGMDHGDRDDTRIDGFQIARHNGLKSLHHFAGDGHGIDAVVRQSGMAAFATDGDFELIAGGHDGSWADRQGADRHAGPVVQTEYRVHGEFVKQAVFDHLARAAATLFGGLEDQHHGAIEMLVFGQMLGCCQQHGGVAVVAASVHLAGVFAGVGKGIGFIDGQCVHVGTQADAAFAVAVFDDADHAGGAHATVNFNAPLGQLACHHIGGALFLETQFGVGVDVAAHSNDAGGFGGDGVKQFHISPSVFGLGEQST